MPAEPTPSHVRDELVALLSGELGREDTRRVSLHLRSCPGCCDDLVDAAIGFGSLRAADRVLGPAPSGAGIADPPLPPLCLPSERRRHTVRRSLAAAGAAVAAAAAVVAGVAIGDRNHGHPGPSASVLASAPLERLAAGPGAGGRVTVARAGHQVIVEVRPSNLPSPGTGHFYEAWLLDPATNKMMAMGVLPATGSTTFEVPADLLGGYSAVDVSLQADNGDPAHSDTSVLRATEI